MARPLRIEYPGAFYHALSRGNEQKDIFKSMSDREKFLTYLASATERYNAVFHAYCLMSNHYHLMVETPLGNLSQIMKHINCSYTTYFNIKHNRAGHLLQGRYKAILVEADAYAAELSRYIHLNPVRAGKASSPDEYRWSSFRHYTGGTEPSWLSTGSVLGYFGDNDGGRRRNYRDYILEAVEKEYVDLLSGSIASTILGSEGFVEVIKEKFIEGRDQDRDLPALRELTGGPDLFFIKAAAEEAFSEEERLARMAGIYLCRRFSRVKLKEIGELFDLSDSGVTQASRRFETIMTKDESIGRKVQKIVKKLSISKV